MTITIDVFKAVETLIYTAFFLGGIWCFAVAVVGGL
tara:strand:+ start:1141 stop:1248 length:108 start_codon:yes stop_codon:yes gene_type:complete